MKQTKNFTLLWLAAGLLFSMLALLVVWTGLSDTVWVTDPEGIPEAADAVLNSLHAGDWAALEKMVIGRPALTPAAGETDSAENLIWEAYRKSLQWTCKEEFGMQGSYILQKVSLNCLDIRGVTNAISEILSDSGEYRLDPTNQAQLLHAATKQALESEAPIIQREITLTFQREQERWLLVPNNALQMLLSGFTTH